MFGVCGSDMQLRVLVQRQEQAVVQLLIPVVRTGGDLGGGVDKEELELGWCVGQRGRGRVHHW